MFLLLLSHLLLQYDAQATPLPTREQIPPQTDSNRSLFNIIWSCLSTITICAWVSVHPNVPPRGQLSAVRRRIWMMLWTIIAPELVLAWAVRQRSAARMVAKKYEDRGWTDVHGHFLIMGGFTLVNRNVDKEPKEPKKLCWFAWLSLSPERKSDYKTKRQQYEADYRRYNLGPVSFQEFNELVATSSIDFPVVTLADIKDKSKGDFLSKTFAIVQTTWFLLQCSARIPQRLALTELELATLALASLNAVTYFFWWNKPLEAQEPVKLVLTKASQDTVEEDNNTTDDGSRNEVGVLSKIYEVIQQVGCLFWRFLWNPCQHGPLPAIAFILIGVPIFLIGIFLIIFPIAIVFLLSILKTNKSPSTEEHHPSGNRRRIAARIVSALHDMRLTLTIRLHDFFQERFDEVWDGSAPAFILGLFIIFPLLLIIFIILILLLLPLFTLFFLISFIFHSIFGIIATATIPSRAHHVPAFYAPITDSDQYSRMLVFAFFGVLFGGLHGIAWFFEFPHHFEQTLWRVGSIVITGIPLIVAPIDFLIEWKGNSPGSFWLPDFAISTLDFVMTMLLFIYVLTRLSLIGQSIALLRAQPESAFRSVDWAKFVPHIFSS